MITEDDDSRRAAFAKMNEKELNVIRTESRKKGKGWHEEKDIRTDKARRHQEVASKSKKPSNELSNARIVPQDSDFYFNVGKKTLPFLSTSILGVPISTTLANATFNSIKDSYKCYEQRNNIDDALFIGMKSFVNNYAKNFTFEYLQNNSDEKDDDIFNEVLEVTILLSSVVIDSFF